VVTPTAAAGSDNSPYDDDTQLQRYHRSFQQSGVAQALLTPDGIISAVNEQACAIVGLEAEDLIGQPMSLPVRVDSGGSASSAFADLSQAGSPAQFERRLQRRDGVWIDVLISLSNVTDDNGEVVDICVCLQDITSLKAAQRATEEAQARWRSLSQNASDIAVIVGTDLVVTYVSPSLTRLLGHPESDVLGTSLLTLVHPEDSRRLAAALGTLIQSDGGEMSLTFRVRDRSGRWVPVEQRAVNLLGDGHVNGLVLNLRDQTKEIEMQQTLRRAALEDGLTGLPNRTLVMDRIQQAIQRHESVGTSCALIVVNIDRFQTLNDVFGHARGDQVLCMMADTLCALVRPNDTVSRYAGDQFVVLIDDDTEPAEVEAVGRRIAGGLNTVFDVGGGTTVHVSARVGVAHAPASNAEALVSAAEAATYHAKQLGRGRVYVLEQGLRDRMADRRALADELTAAVAAHELAVHYQPIVSLRTGRIVGFEALVRWPHAARGLVGPDSFLPLADDLDLLLTIDDWVLNEACRTARLWTETNSLISVSVNVAPSRLTTPGFADNIRRALAESGLPGTCLVLEVTETAVVADVAAAQLVLGELSASGVRVAIDDFGTGYSSMLQLRELPFDALKIDREFVRGLPISKDDIAICGSISQLADSLGVRSIAEGVETGQQAANLTALGCGFGQGFLWSPAVDAGEAILLLERQPWEGATADAAPSVPVFGGLTDDPSVGVLAGSLLEAGASLHTIAARLNRSGSRTLTGRRWQAATVARLLYRPRG
jgi:diguanylate cyclase (GGDEF)-like protein/PAS domain S-box-containing protein